MQKCFNGEPLHVKIYEQNSMVSVVQCGFQYLFCGRTLAAFASTDIRLDVVVKASWNLQSLKF